MAQTQPVSMRTSRPLTAGRFWSDVYDCNLNGWILIKNMHTAHTLRVYFGSQARDNDPHEVIKPLHSRAFQVSVGDQIWLSSAITGQAFTIQNATYLPKPDEYSTDADVVENLPYSAGAVAVTTTYDFTDTATYATIRKGHISHLQVVGEAGAFVGTLEISDDNGTTYSPAVTFDPGDPNKIMYEIHKVLTHVRVTVTAGTFFIEAY